MICEECKKKSANVYINKKIGDTDVSRALCSECLENQKQKSRSAPVAEIRNEVKLQKKKSPPVQCATCHCTLPSFEASLGFTLGCPDCYRHFGEQIARKLRYCRGELVYSGRSPLRQRRAAQRAEYLEKLRAEMGAAISCEDFERALTLREMIKSLT
jgi:protein arginine kinase activator